MKMILTIPRRCLPLLRQQQHQRSFSIQTPASPKRREPLRILFCGSDNFSCASLNALHKEHARNGDLIEKLDVMVLPPKRAGRGNKQLREVPCKILAEKLGLRIHQRSTFREWEPPEGTNLIIAVSFGLFVPSRILRGAKYGGLNVHPSLLPDLRGPAPVHHVLLKGDTHTGVSLQTLDEKAFDHGAVLAQTPRKGFPIPKNISLSDLTTQLADIGADMLVQGLRDGLYLPPHTDVSLRDRPQGELRHAPKLTKDGSKIDWGVGVKADGEELDRKMRGKIQVFGSVWTEGLVKNAKPEGIHKTKKRLVFKDVDTVRKPLDSNPSQRELCGSTFLNVRGRVAADLLQDKPEEVVYHSLTAAELEKEDDLSIPMEREETGKILLYWGGKDVWLRVGRITVEGEPEKPAAEAVRPFLTTQEP